MDLGVALFNQKKFEDALKQFENVLRDHPGNAAAQGYVRQLQNRTSLPAGP